jgi:hypothetical protein
VSDPTPQPPLPGHPWNTQNEPTPPYYAQEPPAYNGQQQPPYYAQQPPPQYYAQQPPPGYPAFAPPPPPPPPKNRMPWLLAGVIALVVALVGGTAAVFASRSGGDSAGSPVPTGSYTDGLSNSSTEPSDEPTSSDEPTQPPPSEPVPSPTPTEQRRTLQDVDKGLKVYDDVYVEPAKGWRKYRSTKYSVGIEAQGRGGAALVIVTPVGYPAASAVPNFVHSMIEADHLTGVQKGAVKTLRPANSNIASQAELSFSGRFKQNGVSVSLAGRCTTMTGVESIHNVTVTLCVEARKDNSAAAFRAATRMLASVARSI